MEEKEEYRYEVRYNLIKNGESTKATRDYNNEKSAIWFINEIKNRYFAQCCDGNKEMSKVTGKANHILFHDVYGRRFILEKDANNKLIVSYIKAKTIYNSIISYNPHSEIGKRNYKVLYEHLTISEAKEKLLEMFNERFEEQIGTICSTWKEAVKKSKDSINCAYNGNIFYYDGMIYKII